MNVFAIADLHLSVSVPEKNMEKFGPKWTDYHERLEKNWCECVADEDLVLIPGDICWASKIEQAVQDLEWIDRLPGTKVMIRGNHDYWWSTASKVRAALPKSCHIIQNDAFNIGDFSIAGARLWDTPEFNFDGYIDIQGEPPPKRPPEEKIFNREIERLEMSLKKLDQNARHRIAMTHYPPISADLHPSKVSALLEKYNVECCLFGHLHSLKENVQMFGKKNGVDYIFTAADFLEFVPRKVFGS